MNIIETCVQDQLPNSEVNRDETDISPARSDSETSGLQEKLPTADLERTHGDLVAASSIQRQVDTDQGTTSGSDCEETGVDDTMCLPDLKRGFCCVHGPSCMSGVAATGLLPDFPYKGNMMSDVTSEFTKGIVNSPRCVFKFDLPKPQGAGDEIDSVCSGQCGGDDDLYKLSGDLAPVSADACALDSSSTCRQRRPRSGSILRLRDGGAIKRISQSDLPLWAARYISVTTLLLVAAYYVYPSVRWFDPNSTATIFLHLLCFTIHFGTQCWVTFIAGIVLFFNLPRVIFGQVQSRLFPIYFEMTLVMSAITLVTYTIRHPYETWDQSDVVQTGALITCLVSTLLNAYVIAPKIVTNMLKVFEMEHALGVGYAVGYADRTDLRQDPRYNSCYRRFRQVHGISGLANLITMVCNATYLYYLACQCVYVNLR